MPKISLTGRYYYIDPKNPSPALDRTPVKYYIYKAESPRLMYTIGKPKIGFSFQAPPTSFEMQGFGAEINEIKRPYSLPIADVYGGKLRRLSFEFAIIRKVKVPATPAQPAVPAVYDNNGRMTSLPVPAKKAQEEWFYYDGMAASVEDQLERLQFIVDTGIPVGFENISPHVEGYSWLIDDMKWTFNRDDSTGLTVAATCSMSFIEYRPARQRFILMPRFGYGVPAAAVKATAKNQTGGSKVTAAPNYLRTAFLMKVATEIASGRINYPLSRAALQKLLDIEAGGTNIFTIPQEWIDELNKNKNLNGIIASPIP